MCRKSYQRSKYAAEKAGPKPLCEFYLEHIKAQLERIRLWRPEATFTIQLERPAKQRLTLYNDALRRNRGNAGEAKAAVAVQPALGAKGKVKPLSLVDAVKVEHAEHIDAHFSGPAKSLGYLVSTVVPWIEGEVERDSMVQMPPIEFLLHKPAAGEVVHDPSTSYERWVASVDGVSFPASASPSPPPKKRKSPTININPRHAAELLARPPPTIKVNFKKAAENLAASPPSVHLPRPASDLPLYRSPPPIGESSKKRKRPAPVDTALANGTCTTAPATPGSAYTLVDVPPMMRRGMVFGGGTKTYVRRDEQDGDESEAECESPLAKKSRVE